MITPATVRSRVIALAEKHGVRYQTMAEDRLAEVVTRLSGDDVVTDEIEDLIVALRLAKAISGPEMVELLSGYLVEKHS